jgi:hypothetical protein
MSSSYAITMILELQLSRASRTLKSDHVGMSTEEGQPLSGAEATRMALLIHQARRARRNGNSTASG